MAEMTKIKICGLRRAEDVRLCLDLGVDILGFVTEYPGPVPWNLSAEEVRTLLSHVAPPGKSCLVTGGAPKKVIDLASRLRPDYIQLHYHETLEETREIIQALKPLGIGVIKAVPRSAREQTLQFHTQDLKKTVELLCEAEVSALLADSRTPENAHEKSALLDADFFQQIKRYSSKPVILAGGITPLNAASLLAQTKADYIDVMSGVECRSGVKDKGLLRGLIESVENYRV